MTKIQDATAVSRAAEACAPFPSDSTEVLRDLVLPSQDNDGTLLHAHFPLRARKSLRLSVLMPVYNERHVVEASAQRVLALDHPRIASLDLIIVDDCSTDGTSAILRRIAASDDRVTLIRHDRNRGKGGALRTAIAHARGDVTICHDADLEYDPADIPALLEPFVREGADAVFGSRYLAGQYRRALMHRHTLINKTLTFVSNCFTDLDLTDLETCYKAVRTPLLQSIPLRSDDFRIEVELSFKLAKRRARIFEAPIRYMPRTHAEGKKIGLKDGVLALAAMVRHSLVDDLYCPDEYGSHQLRSTRNFETWLADVVRPHVGNRVLELGAAIGTYTSQLIPRDYYVAGEANPHFLEYLNAYSLGKPYLHVARLDENQPELLEAHRGRYDTVLVLNRLELAKDPASLLFRLREALEPGGKLVLVAPQDPKLFGPLDETLERRRRYRPDELRELVEQAGYEVELLEDLNRFSRPAWWLSTKTRRREFPRTQLKMLDTAMPILRRVEPHLPWRGLSLLLIARRS